VAGDASHVVVVIGDGSLTNGMAFEALNHIVEINQRIIVIINDNEQSISNNIGAMNKILGNLDSAGIYVGTKEGIKNTLHAIPYGEKITSVISNTKNDVKNISGGPREFFTTLGYRYFGLIDGHNLESLNTVLNYAKKIDGPTIIHVRTKKGKGYEHAEKCVIGR